MKRPEGVYVSLQELPAMPGEQFVRDVLIEDVRGDGIPCCLSISRSAALSLWRQLGDTIAAENGPRQDVAGVVAILRAALTDADPALCQAWCGHCGKGHTYFVAELPTVKCKSCGQVGTLVHI